MTLVTASSLADKEAQRNFFSENGYIGAFALPNLTSLEALVKGIEQSESPRAHLVRGIKKRLGLNAKHPIFVRDAHIRSRLVYQLASEPTILEDVANLLGPDILLWISEAISRKPGSRGQSWHIDIINAQISGVHVSVALTDMNRQNGCLQVIPKTHTYTIDLQECARQGACNLYDPESLLALADRLHPENAPHQIVPLEMKKGEYSFTKGGLWHGVGNNSTQQNRLGLVARYMQTDRKCLNLKEQPVPCLLVRGKDRYQLNDLHQPPN
ncbi:MAG: phytanoyl-CoA dioxygenase family protein [Cyanobacteria bacterium SID2]|nr:phytanoyl-CoA dioxygenase family protein [Cyanobacteria bacterium SID2]MBP0006065.1 phytanoyl-CoA dioxygenase family protein [Cyanobacteria bacterium SBC]